MYTWSQFHRVIAFTDMQRRITFIHKDMYFKFIVNIYKIYISIPYPTRFQEYTHFSSCFSDSKLKGYLFFLNEKVRSTLYNFDLIWEQKSLSRAHVSSVMKKWDSNKSIRTRPGCKHSYYRNCARHWYLVRASQTHAHSVYRIKHDKTR